MTTSLDDFGKLFPALERYTWLNTATVPPGCEPVLRAAREALEGWERGKFSWQAWEGEAYATRELFARLIGVEARTVALMSSVAEAASTVAAALPPGKVVVGEREFHSNIFPWTALRERGFEVEEVQAEDDVVSTDALIAAVDERTVLVAVSEVQSSNGYRVDVRRLAEACRAAGARLFVNLTQSLGALRFDAAEVGADYVAAHGYKWLLGMRGAAWMHVREDRLEALRPIAPNWHSIRDPYADYYGSEFDPAPGAGWLDTSIDWMPWIGSRAALELVASLDREQVERHALALSAAFRAEVTARGFEVVREEVPTQIVSLRVPDPEALVERLRERRVVGAVRGGSLRLGFHGFNRGEDVETALDALEASAR